MLVLEAQTWKGLNMIRCFICNSDSDTPEGIILNCDGDMVCGKECKAEFDRRREYFFENIVHSEEKTEAYLMGEDI